MKEVIKSILSYLFYSVLLSGFCAGIVWFISTPDGIFKIEYFIPFFVVFFFMFVSIFPYEDVIDEALSKDENNTKNKYKHSKAD